jgi:outer membrane receptor protein involved in Fe transport
MRVPEHSAGVELSATPRDGTTLTAGLTYVGSYRQVDALWQYRCLAAFTPEACPASFLATFSTRGFIVDYPGFAKINATITHRFTPQLEAFASVDNLMNSEAYEGTNTAPVIGRTTMVGIHFTY